MTPAEIMARSLCPNLYLASWDHLASGRTEAERRCRVALNELAMMKLPEVAGEAAFAAASLSDAWHIEDVEKFEAAFRAAMFAMAAIKPNPNTGDGIHQR